MKTRLFLDFDTVDVVSALDERRNPSSDATVHIQCVLFHRVEVFAASDFGVFVILVLRGLNLYEEILERNESFGCRSTSQQELCRWSGSTFNRYNEHEQKCDQARHPKAEHFTGKNVSLRLSTYTGGRKNSRTITSGKSLSITVDLADTGSDDQIRSPVSNPMRGARRYHRRKTLGSLLSFM